jgi:hypothetical protein
MYRLLFFGIAILSTAQAQWSTDPLNPLIVGFGLNSEICSDSNGGLFVAYENSSTFPRRIEVCRLNRYGYQTWSSPRFVVGERAQSAVAGIVADGCGGVIVTYRDEDLVMPPGLLLSRVRAQRIDSSGTFLWGALGVRVSTVEFSVDAPQVVVPDGAGGCVVGWIDSLGDVRINRIDSIGTRCWGNTGKFFPDEVSTPSMVSDNRGGCYVLLRGGLLQRLDSWGAAYWVSPTFVPTGGGTLRIDPDNNFTLLGSHFLGFRNGTFVYRQFQEMGRRYSLPEE